MKKLILLFIIFICFGTISNGQALRSIVKAVKSIAKEESENEDVVHKADDLYNSGDYDGCIVMLDSLSKTASLTKKEKENIFILKSKAFLEKDDIPQAENAVTRMLKHNPNYELIEADNNEDYNRLVKKFDIHPLFSIGIRNTLLLPSLKISKTYFVLDNVDYNVDYNAPKSMLMYYGWLEYEFRKSVSVNAEGILFFIQYNRNFTRSGSDWNMYYGETMNFVEIPIYVKKYFIWGKNVYPYVSLGLGYLNMTKAIGNAYISYTGADIFTGENIPYSNYADYIDVLNMRNINNYEWLGGAGIGYKFKNLRINLDFRFYRGLNSLTKSKARFNNETLINDYFYIDNSVKFNKYEIGVSISYVLKNSIKKVKK